MPPLYTDMNTNIKTNIELHNDNGPRASKAKRGERGTLPLRRHEHKHGCEHALRNANGHRANGAKRGEPCAPPLYTDISTNMNYQTPSSVRVLCWDNFVEAFRNISDPKNFTVSSYWVKKSKASLRKSCFFFGWLPVVGCGRKLEEIKLTPSRTFPSSPER